MYGWHRLGNEEEWKNKIINVKYQGKEYCKDCHADKYESINKTPHQDHPVRELSRSRCDPITSESSQARHR